MFSNRLARRPESKSDLPVSTRLTYAACKPLIAMHELACKKSLDGQLDSFQVHAPNAGLSLHALVEHKVVEVALCRTTQDLSCLCLHCNLHVVAIYKRCKD